MASTRPFQELFRISRDSWRLLGFLLLLAAAGCTGLYLGATLKTEHSWRIKLLDSVGSTFLVAALIGVVYELGMRKTTLKEVERIVQDGIPAAHMHERLSKLKIANIFASRSEMSPCIREQLEEVLRGRGDRESVSIDLLGYGLTSFFDQVGPHHELMGEIANATEKNSKRRMRIIFPHPENGTIIERANAQIIGRPTVNAPNPPEHIALEYRRKLIEPATQEGTPNYASLIRQMEKKTRLFTDVFELGAGFFKERALSNSDNAGICVRFTRLNPGIQYVRIGDLLLIEPYHFGVSAIARSGTCLAGPEKDSMILSFDLRNKPPYADLIINHFEYIWTHPRDTVKWSDVMQG